MNKFILSKNEHDMIYANISTNLFKNVKKSNEPTIYIVGGQPGCGKTTLLNDCVDFFKDRNVVIINGDNYRIHHPYIKAIFDYDRKGVAKYTDNDVRDWTKKIFENAILNKYNIVFECTFRTNEICDTMDKLRKTGYKIHTVVRAADYVESFLSTCYRYESKLNEGNVARYTPRESHDNAYTGMLDTLKNIEDKKLSDTIMMYDRSDKCIFTSKYDSDICKKILDFRSSKWTEKRYNDFIDISSRTISLMSKNGNFSEIEKIQKLIGIADTKYHKDYISNYIEKIEQTRKLNKNILPHVKYEQTDGTFTYIGYRNIGNNKFAILLQDENRVMVKESTEKEFRNLKKGDKINIKNSTIEHVRNGRNLKG